MTTLAPNTLAQTAQQAARLNAASATGAPGAAASASAPNALQSLGANFNQFLTLLTTQLKNQDPTSPVNTDQFTQELVQFTGVQQSVQTNTDLTQLISLQQGSEVLQSAQVVGHQATVNAGEIALQNSIGRITFNTPVSEPVQIAIVNGAGQAVRDVTLTSQAGANSWSWNGQDNGGNQLPDGAYGLALETGGSNGTANALAYSTVGTATGLTNGTGGLQLQMGALSVGLASVQGIASH